MASQVRILELEEARAKRFFSAGQKNDVEYYISERCPHCGKQALIVPQQLLTLGPAVQKEIKELEKNLSLPTIARCTTCDRPILVSKRQESGT